MSQLEEYYNVYLKCEDDKDFKDLRPAEKLAIEKSSGYEKFKQNQELGRAIDDLKREIGKELNQIVNYIIGKIKKIFTWMK